MSLAAPREESAMSREIAPAHRAWLAPPALLDGEQRSPREERYARTSKSVDEPAGGCRRFHAAFVMLALAAVVLASGCGGSSKSSSSPAGSSSPAPTKQVSGAPIKTMTITSLNSQGPVYQNIAVSAKAYEKWINARGGIKGHPLQVTICDDHGTPVDAGKCGREAVADHVVAVVGSFSYFGTNIMPPLTHAGIPNFGECCPITPPEWTASNSFPMGNTPLFAVGLVKRAVQDGCQHINAVIIDGAQGFLPPMNNAMKAYGKSFGRTVILPPTSQDYSPQVAQATGGGADCLIMIVSETPFVAWNQAYVQSGAKARIYAPQGNLDSVSLKGVGQALDGSIIGGMFPDITTAPWSDYRQALKDANAPSQYDYNSLGGLGTWAAYTGFKQIVEAIPGNTVSAASFMKQAAKTTRLDTHGMVPVIDFTKQWTANPPLKRLFNRSVVFSQVKGGKVVPLTTGFEDVSKLALGRK
jgi:branched-chain amino acid transport system substrate-binding protein